MFVLDGAGGVTGKHAYIIFILKSQHAGILPI
jgi:hypothetical protein